MSKTNVHTITAPLPYQKYLPEATPETRKQFLNDTRKVDYNPTNNYMFQTLFQGNTDALTNLICSILHRPRSKVKSLEITPIILGKYIANKTFILDIKALLNSQN